MSSITLPTDRADVRHLWEAVIKWVQSFLVVPCVYQRSPGCCTICLRHWFTPPVMTMYNYKRTWRPSRNGNLTGIRRTIPPTLPELRAKAYTTLVRPILEYAATVWDGSLTQTQAVKLEAVQRRAARTVYNIPRTDHQTSTTQHISQLSWQTLDTRRNCGRLGLFRAIHFHEVATDMTKYIQLQPHSVNTRRDSQQYLIPYCNTYLNKKASYQLLYCGIILILIVR